MSGVSGRDDNVDTIRIAAEKRAIEIGADFNVYTDGSASGGLIDGGAGVVVTRGNPTSPDIVKTKRWRGAHFTCCYEEEKKVLEEAVCILVKYGCAAKFFNGNVHELPIFMCGSAWKVYFPEPPQIQV